MAFRRGKDNRKWKERGLRCDPNLIQAWSQRDVSVGSFLLDSGAHTLYNRVVLDAGKTRETTNWAYYHTPAFYQYIDEYCQYVIEHKDSIDVYATVDVIYNPALTWKTQQYIEKVWKLKPLPVLHYGTPMDWILKYIRAGYDYLGIGGLGQETTWHSYKAWADQVYDLICDPITRKPTIKTHGFAMTSFKLLTRYPWYSTDSSSWAKMAGYGMIFAPHKRNGKFTFVGQDPYYIAVSHKSKAKVRAGRHYLTLSSGERKVLEEWLELIGIPLGKNWRDREDGVVVEDGVVNQYGLRAVANMRYYERLMASIPEWPWAWKVRPRKGFFSAEEVKWDGRKRG